MRNTAVLLVSCPDRKGIVASIANFLYKYNANILHADEHQDYGENTFFLRVEWDLNGFALGREEFLNLFAQLAEEFKMRWEVKYTDETINTAIFVSKEDHCLADLLYKYKNGEFKCNISVIISNHLESKQLADFYSIPFHYIPIEKDIKEEAENQIQDILKVNNVKLIILARYMQILSNIFIEKFNNPIINIHHSFLPAFIGAKPYHQAFERGVKIIGATSHYVTKDLDQGPIIEQDILRVSHRDNIDDLVRKGKDIEKNVLSRAVNAHLANRIVTYKNKTVVFD